VVYLDIEDQSSYDGIRMIRAQMLSQWSQAEAAVINFVANAQDDEGSQDPLKCRSIDSKRIRKVTGTCFTLAQSIGDTELGSHVEDLRRLRSECSAKERLGCRARVVAGIHTWSSV
jgi:hypothetical protein